MTEKETIQELGSKIRSKEISVQSLVDKHVKKINDTADLNIIRNIHSDIAQQIVAAEEMFINGTQTALTGIPFVVKDNILVQGQKASAGSKMLESYTATYSATVVDKLKNAGAILLASANMDEFAMGSSTENSAYGVTKNPINTERVPGGSSGGSAAAIAASVASFSLGTDTGGSIRQPASFCGVVGLKPTYGSVSRYGAMAMGSSLDQIGPFANTVSDAELIFECIRGEDKNDATTIKGVSKLGSTGNKKIGVPFDFIKKDGVDKEVIDNFNQVIEKLKKEGYEIIDISLPYLHYALSVYYILMPAEVSSNLARYDGIRYGLSVGGSNSSETFSKSRAAGFGKEVRRRILLGTYILSHGYYDAYYNKAIIMRSKIRKEFEQAFENVSIILTPTTPTTAFKIGEKSSDPLSMYMADIFTVPANIAGVPALSVPSGFDSDGLPFGVQFTAPHYCEQRLFEIGKVLESLLD